MYDRRDGYSEHIYDSRSSNSLHTGIQYSLADWWAYVRTMTAHVCVCVLLSAVVCAVAEKRQCNIDILKLMYTHCTCIALKETIALFL